MTRAAPTRADRALTDAANAVILSFEGSCAALPPHQRVSLQLLQLALEIRVAGEAK